MAAEIPAKSPAEIPSEAQVLEWMSSLSNWGRWGQTDQLGCLNLITPAKRKAAAALVRDGVSVSCARPIVTDMASDVTFQVQRYMVDSQEGRETDPPERRRTRRLGIHRHGLSRPDHHPYRRSIPLLLGGHPLQRCSGQPRHLSRRRTDSLCRTGVGGA